ncbi:hypothetical protein J2T20_003777 [Paenibacillus wynnii]|nr:hypothetical protein [Paenibacillus wynnii]
MNRSESFFLFTFLYLAIHAPSDAKLAVFNEDVTQELMHKFKELLVETLKIVFHNKVSPDNQENLDLSGLFTMNTDQAVIKRIWN